MKTLNLMILALFLTGCSAFEQQMKDLGKDDHLYCHPVTDVGNECTGYLMLDKPVIITEEEIDYETTDSQEEESST